MASTPVYIDKGRKKTAGTTVQSPLRARSRATSAPVTPIAAMRVSFGKAPVDCVTMRSASEWLMSALEGTRGTPHLVMGPNAFLVALAQRDSRFAEALAHASLCLPDGISVVWGSRLLGKAIPERVTGGEFMETLCAMAAERGRSVYFLGGLPGAAASAAKALASRYPGLVVAGTDCPAKGFDQDPASLERVLERIRVAQPDLLCIAFGAPKQEIWMLDHCLALPIGAALSVGAAFDTQAGLRKRAPKWTHGTGVEWLYRLAMEPRRLWRRYLIGNAQFAAILLREVVRVRKQRATENLLRPRPVFKIGP